MTNNRIFIVLLVLVISAFFSNKLFYNIYWHTNN